MYWDFFTVAVADIEKPPDDIHRWRRTNSIVILVYGYWLLYKVELSRCTTMASAIRSFSAYQSNICDEYSFGSSIMIEFAKLTS